VSSVCMECAMSVCVYEWYMCEWCVSGVCKGVYGACVCAIGSRYHISEVEKELLKKLQITKFTSIGSSLKVAKISSNSADVYITTTNKMKEWDTCASYSIISEAGGKMTDMLGNDLSYNNRDVNHENGILVTNNLVHDRIITEFKKSD